MLANTVLSALPASESKMHIINLHSTDNRVIASVTDLVDAMAEHTGRKLTWKNKVCAHACAHVYAHTRTRTRTRTHTHTHTPAHAHAHTRTHSRWT